MGIIIDIVLIAIVLLSAFLGYKKGLVKLGAKLFAGLIAIILTIIIYRPVAGIVIKNTNIDEKIKNTIIENTSSIIDEKTQVNNDVTNQIENNILPRQAENISKNVVYAITAVVLFIVVKIILSIVISLIDSIANLPLLKQFNEVGGIAYGIVRGLLIAGILIVLMGAYAKMKPESGLSNEIENTYITKTVFQKIYAIK